jgi:MFS family permease
MSRDVRRILVAQALRAFAYGFGTIALALTLQAEGWSTARVGLLLLGVVGGIALVSVAVGRYGDRLGRRRTYLVLYLGLAATGVAFAVTTQFWVLFALALTGTLSPSVVESGPFTSLEQAMLATGLEGRARNHVFGVYNAVAALAGSVGALAAGGPALLRKAGFGLPADQRLFLLFVPIALLGAALARSLSPAVEAETWRRPTGAPALSTSRGAVRRLAGLFSIDALAGGLVVDALVAYWFRVRFGVSVEVLGLTFFAVGVLQTASFLAAPRLADRFGLLRTMVFTHLPSNVLLAAMAFAPTAAVGIALLLARSLLAQMDVPTRQAYVMGLVTPPERTAAAAYTNTARYVTRPFGPLLAGALGRVALGLPFVVAGVVKSGYDLTLWAWFRNVRLPDAPAPPPSPAPEAALD